MSSVHLANSVVAILSVGEKEISVHKGEARLTFSVKHGEQIERVNQAIPIQFYNLQRAEVLIKIFHEVIQENFASGISQQCFLPVLCREAWVLQEGEYVSTRFQVGLFGRVVFSGVIGARWGVFDPASREVSQFAVEESDAATVFLQKVYGAKREDYDSYAEKAKPVILCGEDGRVQSIALKYLSPSALDANVMLDEDHWAVTLASSNSYMSVGYCGFKGINHGHGMIAYEGIANGRQFLKFAHITTRDRVRGVPDPGRDAETEARVEIFDERPASLRQGPTWRKTRSSVEAMLCFIQAAERNSTYVKFRTSSDMIQRVARDRFIIDSYPYLIGLAALALGNEVLAHNVIDGLIGQGLRVQEEAIDAVNCISWSLRQLLNAGIRVTVPLTEVTPHDIVDFLRFHPEAAE